MRGIRRCSSTIGRDRLVLLTNQQVGRVRLCALREFKEVLMLQRLSRLDEIRPANLEGLGEEAGARPHGP